MTTGQTQFMKKRQQNLDLLLSFDAPFEAQREAAMWLMEHGRSTDKAGARIFIKYLDAIDRASRAEPAKPQAYTYKKLPLLVDDEPPKQPWWEKKPIDEDKPTGVGLWVIFGLIVAMVVSVIIASSELEDWWTKFNQLKIEELNQ